MEKELIFITGFFGARLEEQAQEMAQKKGYAFLSLDEEIQKADGRSVRRICMVMGEHEYRNKEYEALCRITGEMPDNEKSDDFQCGDDCRNGIIICCSDGVLLDDMSRELIEKHTLLVLGADMPRDELWRNAKEKKDTCHAFMHFGTEEEQRAAFENLYQRQSLLFAPYL